MKWKYPNRFSVPFLLLHANDTQVELRDGWFPARPLGFQSFRSRCHLAWAVFTGRMDALEWPEDYRYPKEQENKRHDA